MRSWIDWWLGDRATDTWVIGQLPNAALWVFAAATALRWSPYDRLDPELRLVGTGALVVWGTDELFRGVNPFRRLLGALVLLSQLVVLHRG